ncbi:hypothetical protein RSAG8_11431, partial [Rhizoctonia solani AG-8 WAC10335]
MPMSRQQTLTGQKNNRFNPAKESTLLLEERTSKLGHNEAKERPTRVLAFFEIFVNGLPAPIPESILHNQDFAGVQVVGIVATLKAPEGLFAQCGWFGGDDLDWFWVRITGWEALYLRADSCFRNGQGTISIGFGYASQGGRL